jgi:hypothetical protein
MTVVPGSSRYASQTPPPSHPVTPSAMPSDAAQCIRLPMSCMLPPWTGAVEQQACRAAHALTQAGIGGVCRGSGCVTVGQEGSRRQT